MWRGVDSGGSQGGGVLRCSGGANYGETMRFFWCKFCHGRAGSGAGGAMHVEPTCESYQRMTAEAFDAAHSDAETKPTPFIKGIHIIAMDLPSAHKEDEN